MTIREKLSEIQHELKAPKGRYNSFGKYSYRSCEDILEALKPILYKTKCTVTLNDSVVQIGDRYYICAKATLFDCESNEQLSNDSFAREDSSRSGMSDSQITGTASSYARKYALNGLFCIDDTKDPDTNEYAERGKQQQFKHVEYRCENCGASIEDYFDGKDTVPAAALAKRSKEKFGRVLCIKCGKAAK